MADHMAPTLRLYNTLTRSKDVFVPIDDGNVRLYVCGPTVYDYAHIGNARPIIVFDLLFRLLREIYGAAAVTYVRNITDVDDKINARAARDYPDLPHNEAIALVTRKTEEQFHADIRALGVLMPEDVNEEGQPPRFVEPRATEHIAEMRDIIERLIARGVAYVAEDHVLFCRVGHGAPAEGAEIRRVLEALPRRTPVRCAGGRRALQARRRWISCCGSRRARRTRPGRRRAASRRRVGPAGISSARRWRGST